MVEKSFVAVNFRLTYAGSFSLADLLDLLDRWAEEHHYHKEIKGQVEHNKQNGKELRYYIELWRHVNTQVVAIVRFTALMTEIKDVTISFSGKKERVQHGHVLVDIDSLLERHKLHAYENKPYIFFIRGIIDRFIHKNLFDMHEGPLSSDARNFYDTIRGFFQKEETKRVS